MTDRDIVETVTVSIPGSVDDLASLLATGVCQELQAAKTKSGEHATDGDDAELAATVVRRMPSAQLNVIAHRVAQAGCVVSDRRRRRYTPFDSDQSTSAELTDQIAARACSQIDREIKTGAIAVVMANWVLSWLLRKLATMFVQWLLSKPENPGIACRVAESAGLVSEVE